MQRVGAPGLRQGEAHGHPGHVVLSTLQNQEYKRRGQGEGQGASPEKHLLQGPAGPRPGNTEYRQEEVIIQAATQILPTVNSRQLVAMGWVCAFYIAHAASCDAAPIFYL